MGHDKTFEDKTPQQAAQAALAMSPLQLSHDVAKMSGQQLRAVFSILDEAHDVKWREKVRSAYNSLSDRKLLEEASKALSPWQALEILESIDHARTHHEPKLSPLFVGLSQQAFGDLILAANDKQLQALQHQAGAEPMQHQITLLLHQLEREEQAYTKLLEALEVKITNIEHATLTHEELQAFIRELDQLSEHFDNALHTIDRALALAWNSGRTDLVEGLSQLKEYYHSDSRVGLGYPRESGRAPSGLYGKLERHLNMVYGDPTSPDVLNDEDPSSEALAKLSLWYLIDYWHLGLLPGVRSAKELEAPKNCMQAEAFAEYREKLRHHALENLRRAGLATVGDFKGARIYSKAMLLQYLNDHSQRLQRVKA